MLLFSLYIQINIIKPSNRYRLGVGITDSSLTKYSLRGTNQACWILSVKFASAVAIYAILAWMFPIGNIFECFITHYRNLAYAVLPFSSYC